MNLTVAFWLVPLVAIPALLLGTQAWPRLNHALRVGLIALMLALIGVLGLRLARVVATNITQLPEWDFSFFWLNGQVAARGLNFYDPVQYQRIAQQLLRPNPTLEFQQAVLDVGFWYPPPSMFLFLPLGWMNARTAAVAWFAFHLLALLVDGVLVWHIFLRPQKKLGLLLAFALLLMMGATQLTFYYAQTNALLLLFVLLFYKDRGRGRAGGWLAIAIVVKPIALVLGLVVVLHRQWRVLGVVAGALAFISLAALVVFGPSSFQSFITSSPTTRQPLWVYSEAVNQSLLAVILRQTQISPLTKSPLTNPVFIGLAALLLLVSAWLMVRLGRGQSDWAIAIALALGLIIYPATLNHYSLLLILPLLVLWQARSGLRRWHVGLLTFFMGIVYFWMSYHDGTWAIVANVITWLGICVLALVRSDNLTGWRTPFSAR